jgi:nucleotide-binding universal stress UspA family protein
MYTRLLIPLDGSQTAEQALPYARVLAKGLRVPVTLVHAVDPHDLGFLTDPEHSRYVDTVWADKVNENRDYLERVARSFAGTHARCLVQKGQAEDVVIEEADADKNTLIVMATHGRSGLRRWLLGSVAYKIVHGTANPICLVRAREAKGTGDNVDQVILKTVIVPLDGSALAEQVLPAVIELVRAMNLSVVLLRAYALPVAATGQEFGSYTDELLAQIENEARRYLDGKLQDLKQRGLKDVSAVVKFGYGADEIIGLAHETPQSLVAMCTHGRSGLTRWVLGSVTERVVRHCGDPVLLVRAV